MPQHDETPEEIRQRNDLLRSLVTPEPELPVDVAVRICRGIEEYAHALSSRRVNERESVRLERLANLRNVVFDDVRDAFRALKAVPPLTSEDREAIATVREMVDYWNRGSAPSRTDLVALLRVCDLAERGQ